MDQNQADTFQIEPPERKSSGGGKLLLGISIGCGVMALLCCGVFMGFGYWTANFMASAINTDPAEIRAETQRIAEIDIPERFDPQAAIRLDLPFVDDIGSMVVYGNEAAEETLVLGDYRHLQVGDHPPSEVFRQADPNVGVPPNGQPGGIDMRPDDQDPAFEETSREEYERPMRGGTARFEIIQGTNTDTGQERIIVYGSFPGRRGGGIFMMSVSAENSSVEEVKQVTESLQ